MAIATAFQRIDMKQADLSYDAIINATPTQIQIGSLDGTVTTFHGNVTYTPDLLSLAGGTVSSIDSIVLGVKQYEFSSFANNDALKIKSYFDTNNGEGLLSYLFSADDQLTGSSDDDVLDGFTGNDTIDGGAGNDTVVFAGSLPSYEIVTTSESNAVTVKNNSTGEIDTLKNVEYLRFDDTTIPTPAFIPSDTTPITENHNAAISFASQTTFAVGASPQSVVVGDFNGDNKADLATANSMSSNVSVLLGDGKGGFSEQTTFSVGSHQPRLVSVGDFNGDGKDDLVTANQGSSDNNVSVLLSDGTGGFATQMNFAVGTRPYFVSTGDFNSDGKIDVVAANNGSDNVSVLLGDGFGGLGAQTTFAAGKFAAAISVGDFNGDKKADLAVGNFGDNGGSVSVLLGDGLGGFGAQTVFEAGKGVTFVATADFNSDGKADLATANYLDNTVSVLLGDGKGGFSPQTTFTVGRFPASISVGDFNDDGKSDLVTANYSDNTVSVLLGDRHGSFSAQTTFAVGKTPYVVGVGDFNRDGRTDLVAENYTDSNVSVLLNTTETAQPSIPTTPNVESSKSIFPNSSSKLSITSFPDSDSGSIATYDAALSNGQLHQVDPDNGTFYFSINNVSDIGAYYGGYLNYSVSSVGSGSAFDAPDVIISGGGIRLCYMGHNVPTPNVSENYTIPISTNENWYVMSGVGVYPPTLGRQATHDDFVTVFADAAATSISIRGEFLLGNDEGYLSQASLSLVDMSLISSIPHLISGTSGDDTLSSTSGNDVIDGGAGIDTVKFSDVRGNYITQLVNVLDPTSSVSPNIEMVSVMHHPTGTVDSLTNVEYLQFSDETIPVPTNAVIIPSFISGTSGDDTLTGSSGNDIIFGDAGSDFIDGGEGIDSAEYAGNSTDYFITGQSNGNMSVKNNLTGDIDTLTRVEFLGFADATIPAPPETNIPTEVKQTPSYVLSVDKEVANEGDAVTLTLKTTNVAPETDVPVFFSGNVDDSDIQDGLPASSFHVGADGTAQMTIHFLADHQTEGEEFFVAYLSDDETATDEQFAYVTINDTSVAIENHKPTGTLKVTGTPVKGRVLTATSTLKDADGLGDVHYQWLKNGEEILDATAKTYTLSAHDIESKLKVVASYTDKLGFEESVTSASTVAIRGILSKKPTADDDQLTGNVKSETLSALAGNDVIKGMGGNDTLLGGEGNDTLIGGDGVDKLTGGTGIDVFKFNNAKESGASVKTRDTITDFKQGEDRIDFSSFDANTAVKGVQGFSFVGNQQFSPNATAQLRFDAKTGVLYGSTNKDTVAEFSIKLDGITQFSAADFTKLAKDASGISTNSTVKAISKKPTTGNDQLTGTVKNETFNALDGNDLIKAMGGNDTLLGGNGNDTLIGGIGIDKLTGGAGKDVFKFESIKESGASVKTRDTITDFNHSDGDRIDLSVIDANASAKGLQSFTFIGNQAFGKDATGQLRFDTKTGVLYGSVNKDNAPEFSIKLDGVTQLVATDFTKLAKDASGTATGGTIKVVSKKPSVGDDELTGTVKNESFDALSGNDLIKSMGGNDTLSGGEGNDTLIGGEGADKLTGGLGKDVFKVETVKDSGASTKTRDTITDFHHNEGDLIDLSAIDANQKLAGNQTFMFIGTQKFSADATAQVRFDVKTHVLYGSTNADNAAEFSIVLTGVNELVAADFVL